MQGTPDTARLMSFKLECKFFTLTNFADAVDPLQIKDLNKGTFGFVQLAVDITNGLNYAIKFIERGDRVTPRASLGCSWDFLNFLVATQKSSD